jgi:hypothetical protein
MNRRLVPPRVYLPPVPNGPDKHREQRQWYRDKPVNPELVGRDPCIRRVGLEAEEIRAEEALRGVDRSVLPFEQIYLARDDARGNTQRELTDTNVPGR